MMLEQLCAHLHNWFTRPEDVCAGTFAIVDGALDLSGIVAERQYFRIVGSVFNDGIHVCPAVELEDETFTGEIWPMRVPRAVLELAEEIGDWQEKYGAIMASPYQSESVIGEYSYTKQGGNTSKGTLGSADGWKEVFRSRLNEWRKLR